MKKEALESIQNLPTEKIQVNELRSNVLPVERGRFLY
jgi:hypothetical protein